MERNNVGRSRHRWDEYITVGLKQVWEGMKWICLKQDRDRQHAVLKVTVNCQIHKI